LRGHRVAADGDSSPGRVETGHSGVVETAGVYRLGPDDQPGSGGCCGDIVSGGPLENCVVPR
jgi:hypothetical protein